MKSKYNVAITYIVFFLSLFFYHLSLCNRESIKYHILLILFHISKASEKC